MHLDPFFTNIHIIMPLVLIGSAFITYFIIPKIIWVVKEKELIDHPEERSSHKKSTPTMAGVAFFLTLIVAIFFIQFWDLDSIDIYLITSLTIMFSLGLKDDLVLSTPQAKILGEIVAICFLLTNHAMQFNNFDGFLGFTAIPVELGYFFTGLMILTIINSYNLIDGIDGLASSLGIVIFITYGFIFYFLEHYFYLFLCISLVGILAAFLRYNLSHNKKIFMGDTGSLVVGFCIGMMSLKFLVTAPVKLEVLSLNPENKLILIAVIICVPLFDTFRVMGTRILNKKSPFAPDRNHVHHIIIDRGFSHLKTALILSVSNILIVIVFVYLATQFNSIVMVFILALFTVLLLWVFNKLRLINKKNNKPKSIKLNKI